MTEVAVTEALGELLSPSQVTRVVKNLNTNTARTSD
jgi:hypothetical protein